MTRPEPLLTPRSARVKQARRLAARAQRTDRREFLVEGPHAVHEALRCIGTVREVFLTAAAAQRHPQLQAVGMGQDIPCHVVSDAVVAALSDTVSPQGVVARCGFLDISARQLLGAAPCLITVLVDSRDPGNVGTVIRTADAAGSDGAILAGHSVDAYNPKAVRASVGSIFHLPLAVADDVDVVLESVRDAGLRLIAADGAGSTSLDEAVESGVLAQPTAWLFGNEAWGLPDRVRTRADAVVGVPIYGRAESLNLAAAAALCLYASARAQRQPGGCRRR
ncbi:MAG: RNA methyltransferase [Nocardioidaceae bacterium]|nr:RNA methyltransferase [Nocardioidaceae bacterium]